MKQIIRNLIIVLSLVIPSVISGSSPLQIHRDGKGAYYWIDHYTLDLNIIDYSSIYETYMTPIEGRRFEDCTQRFIDGELQLDPAFFNSYEYWEDQHVDAPINGILGNDFKRLELYIYPNATKIDSVTFALKGRTKVKNNVCDCSGTVRIKKIYRIWTRDIHSVEDYYVIIADCNLKEDASQRGSGEFNGIFAAYGYIPDDTPGIIMVDDLLHGVADDYENRCFVGTWRSYRNPALLKRCMWSDFRLPFRFDFDIGAGEICVTSEYSSPEWDRFMEGEDFEYVYDRDSGRITTKYYKDPWW